MKKSIIDITEVGEITEVRIRAFDFANFGINFAALEKAAATKLLNEIGLSEVKDEESQDDNYRLDPEILCVNLTDGSPWDAISEGKVDEFLNDWGLLRPKIRHAVFEHYQSVRDDYLLYETDEALLPEPVNDSAIEDHFMIINIHLLADGLLGLSGPCLWDDEHGFGVVLDRGQIVRAGHAAEAME